MADKEEMILILTTKNEDGECATQDGCFANDRYAICSASIPKKKAIDIMAKAMFVILPRFSNLEYKILACEILAKEALNALLEGVKK